uniref:SGNH hydrolase-type esterase domain-containing protein n=1 Tax=Pyrodinium bahamense TaxID=73915 RepID=A0A7S0BBQ9_9DINO
MVVSMALRAGSNGAAASVAPILLLWLGLCRRALALTTGGTASHANLSPQGAVEAQHEVPIKVACVGASITQGLLASPGRDYPSQLQALLGPGFRVANFGHTDTTALRQGQTFDAVQALVRHGQGFRTACYQNTRDFQDALAFQPDVVVIQFGANDSKDYNWQPHSGEFVRDYSHLVGAFTKLSSHPKVYLMLPPPLYKQGVYSMNATVVNEAIPSLIQEVAIANGLPPPVDVFGTFKEHCPPSLSMSCDWISLDGCHPNDVGYWHIAETVGAAIKAPQ